MKRRLLYTLGPIVFIMVAFTISPAQVQLQQAQPAQQAQPVQLAIPYKPPLQIFKAVTLEEARKAVLAQLPQMYDSGFTSFQGVSNASYNLMTGELWATSIHDGTATSSGYSVASTGFRSSAIQNTGTSTWKNVTVIVATQLILAPGASSGPITSNLSFPRIGILSGHILNGAWRYGQSVPIALPGQQYVLTSAVGDLAPGSILQGFATMIITSNRNNGASAYGKVVSININL
jgi:hypothetical protein